MKTIYHIGTSKLLLHIKKPGNILGEVIPSITTQANLLGISRSSIYYQKAPISLEDVMVMHKIDEIYTKRPFYGVRKITRELKDNGLIINHKRVHGLMQDMGIQGLIPKKNLSQNNLPHPKYPYLLKGVSAKYPNRIWGTDITYIRIEKGFLYLVAYLDWYSRFVLSWKLSTTLELGFVLEAAEQALNTYGSPEIENSDQGVQYTSDSHIRLFENHGTKVSMDGRGRAMDNIFTERLWRSVKYEEIYLKNYESVMEAKEQINAYMNFYNNERIHQSLNYKTPKEVYFGKEKT